jgi:putative FmdB family regulatory protein
MPTYEYFCPKCQINFEDFKTISKRKESICPNCGNKKNDCLIGRGNGIIFKGSGFYETDYKRQQSAKKSCFEELGK